MIEMPRCPQCGADLSTPASPGGRCPRCLLRLALPVDPEGAPARVHDPGTGATEDLQSVAESPERIGDFRILRKLGEGGMGEVYGAEQCGPVRRRVALKLIKLGMDSRQVVARLESERQALALMDHPNIARVFEAGMTEQSRPYFAMEYVAGVPITRYCDRHRLSTHA